MAVEVLVFDLGGSQNLRSAIWKMGAQEVYGVERHLVDNVLELRSVLNERIADSGVNNIAGSIAGKFKRRPDGSSANVILNSPNLKWIEGVDLTSLVQVMSVGFDNDTVCSALGDAVLLPQLDRIFSCTISSGIGGRQVIHGDVPNKDIEPGHLQMFPGFPAPPCGCSGKGCFESYLGGFLNKHRVRQHAAAYGVTIRDTWKELDVAWNAKRPWAVSFYKDYANALGMWFACIRKVYDIQAIVYKGGVLKNAPWLVSMAREAMLEHLGGYRKWGYKKNLAIFQSPKPEDNSLIGAGRLIQLRWEKALRASEI